MTCHHQRRAVTPCGRPKGRFACCFPHLEYWDNETLRLYPAFYQAFLDLLEHEEGNEKYAHAPAEFHKAFRAISLSILEHTQSIARELYLPPLGAALYENYRRNGQTPPEPQAGATG